MWGSHVVEDEVSVCEERNLLGYFIKYLPQNELLLEAGCGLGAWVICLKKRGYNIEGVDHDARVISRIKAYDNELPVQQGNILNLPYEDDSLGAYISLGVVEHFEEGEEEALAEAWRILKPGGIVIFTVPYNNLFRRLIAHPLRHLYLELHKLRGGSVHFAEYRYSEFEACRMLEKTGFNIVETDRDDFISKSRSLALWSEFPFLQSGSEPYSLNIVGKVLAYVLNSISERILAAGVLIVARKP